MTKQDLKMWLAIMLTLVLLGFGFLVSLAMLTGCVERMASHYNYSEI